MTYAKIIEEAREECRTIEAETPNDENDYKLVHCIGEAVNAEEITDQAFGVTCENSYRLVRTVEMYQIKEIVTEVNENDEMIKKYTYEEGWFGSPIDSSGFDNKEMQNPSNTWPFKSETLTAQNVTVGNFRLNSA